MAARVPLALVLFGLGLAWPLPSLAAADAASVAAATARVSVAGETLAAAEAAPGQLAPLARAVAAYGAALDGLRAEVQAAGADATAVAVALEARRLQTARLLAAMQTISATPGQVLHPQGPAAAAQAAAMMRRLTPAMRAQATELSRQLAMMQAAREVQASGKEALSAGLVKLAAAQAALETAMEASAPPAEPDPALAALARESLSLTQLSEALADQPVGAALPSVAASGEAAAEGMAWPAAGQVIRRYDEPDGAGVRRPGIVLGASPRALVTSPGDALVRYAGPFLEYGYVVMLEPAADTMVVLAGLARLQVASGAVVRRGDLLGLMGGRPPDVEEYVMQPDAADGSGALETLYIEVRRGDGPVDPEPLFSGQNG